MLEYNNDKEEATVTCEECGKYEILSHYSFQEAVARIKELGWSIRLEEGLWAHYCPECQ